MKALSSLFICALVLLASCKKEESEPYTSFAANVIGKWLVSSSTTNNGNATENYPSDIESSTLNFKANAEIELKIVCNSGIANRYLVSESGGILIQEISTTELICENVSSSQVWTNRILNTLSDANYVVIDGNTMSLFGTDGFSISLERL